MRPLSHQKRISIKTEITYKKTNRNSGVDKYEYNK